MGKCTTTYREVRFIFEAELTQVYVLVDAVGDCPLGVQGSHHKTFPASISMQGIIERIAEGQEDPILWPLEAPPPTGRAA